MRLLSILQKRFHCQFSLGLWPHYRSGTASYRKWMCQSCRVAMQSSSHQSPCCAAAINFVVDQNEIDFNCQSSFELPVFAPVSLFLSPSVNLPDEGERENLVSQSPLLAVHFRGRHNLRMDGDGDGDTAAEHSTSIPRNEFSVDLSHARHCLPSVASPPFILPHPPNDFRR